MKPIGKGMVWFVLLGELMLFLTVYHREISWCPPTNFDQAVYLDRSYLLQESVAHSGLQELLRPFVTGGHDNGIALPVEGALLGLFIGPARLARLFVGFIAFVLLQLCVYFSATRIWKNRSYGLVALGLVLSQSTAWFWAGGLFDYRIDFLAYCLFGIWTCLVLRSGMFHDRKWAIASALVGVLLVLNRFFTIIYLSGVLLGFGAALVVVWMFLGRGEPPELNLKKRYSNLAISSLILLAGTIPLLLLNAKAIYGYYVYPHLISGEQYVRAREFGVTDLSTNLAFYPKSIVLDHLGLFFLGAAAVAILAGAFLFFSRRSRTAPSNSGHGVVTPILELIFLLGAIAGPLVVLTSDISKSPIVGGIVGVPCALLVAWPMVVWGGRRAREARPALYNRVLGITAGAVLCLGILNQLARASNHRLEYANRDSYERLAELNRWFVTDASDHRILQPVLSTDLVSPWFMADLITASGFEQTGKLVPFRQSLGGTIAGVERDQALADLEQSDYVILTTAPKIGVYPFYDKIRKYWDDLKAWSEQNMLVAWSIPFEDYVATVYKRPVPKLAGVSGDWITSRGLDLEAEGNILERFPIIILTGIIDLSWLPRIPAVSALANANGEIVSLPATLERKANDYTILVDASSLKRQGQSIRIHLGFDTFFVPKTLGINSDVRELVIRAPSRVTMRPMSNEP